MAAFKPRIGGERKGSGIHMPRPKGLPRFHILADGPKSFHIKELGGSSFLLPKSGMAAEHIDRIRSMASKIPHLAEGGPPVNTFTDINPKTNSLWYAHIDTDGHKIYDKPVAATVEGDAASNAGPPVWLASQAVKGPLGTGDTSVSAPVAFKQWIAEDKARKLDVGKGNLPVVNKEGPQTAAYKDRRPELTPRREGGPLWAPTQRLFGNGAAVDSVDADNRTIDAANDALKTEWEARMQRKSDTKPGAMGVLGDAIKSAESSGQTFIPPTATPPADTTTPPPATSDSSVIPTVGPYDRNAELGAVKDEQNILDERDAEPTRYADGGPVATLPAPILEIQRIARERQQANLANEKPQWVGSPEKGYAWSYPSQPGRMPGVAPRGYPSSATANTAIIMPAPKGSEGQAFEEVSPAQELANRQANDARRAYDDAFNKRMEYRDAHPDGNPDEDTPESRVDDAKFTALINSNGPKDAATKMRTKMQSGAALTNDERLQLMKSDEGIGRFNVNTAQTPSDMDEQPEKLAHGGSVKPSIVRETPREIHLKLAHGPILRIAKAAMHPDHIASIRMMCGGVAHLADGGAPDEPLQSVQPTEGPTSEDPYVRDSHGNVTGLTDAGQTHDTAEPEGLPPNDPTLAGPVSAMPAVPPEASQTMSHAETPEQTLYRGYLEHVSPGVTPVSFEDFAAMGAHGAQQSAENQDAFANTLGAAARSEYDANKAASAPQQSSDQLAATGAPDADSYAAHVAEVNAFLKANPAYAPQKAALLRSGAAATSGGGGFPSSHVDTRAFDQGEQAVLGANKALGDLAQAKAAEEVGLQTDVASKLDSLQKDYKSKMDDTQGAADLAFNDYMNAKVDPDRLFRGNAAAQITAAISMALGAFGSTLGRTPNFAAQIIDKAIDRDIEQQQADIGKKQSIVQHYLNQGASLQNALKLAKGDLLDAAAAKANILAAKFGGSEKAAQLAQAAGDFRMKAFGERQSAVKSAIEAQWAPTILGTDQRMKQAQIRHLDAENTLLAAKAGAKTATPDDLTTGTGIYDYYQRENKKDLPKLIITTTERKPLTTPDGKTVTDTTGKPRETAARVTFIANDPAAATEAKKQLAATEEQGRKLQAIQNYINEHPHGAWTYADWKDGNRLIGDFKLSFLKSEEGLNRFNENEHSIVNQMVSYPNNPAAAFVGNPQASVDSFRDMIRTRRNVLKETYLHPLPDGYHGR